MCKNRINIFRFLVAALLLVGTSNSWAHQQWLSPNFFLNEAESAWVTFDHTFGDERFLPSSGPSSYFHYWIISPDGVRRPLQSIFIGQTRVVGEVELKEAGTYRLEGVEQSMTWTQLKIDGEDVWNPGSRKDFPGAEIVASRRYHQMAVTYVTLGSTSIKAITPSNAPLEIVFKDHPNELKFGESFRVSVLASGKPVAGQEINVYSEQTSGHDAAASCTTDAEGNCTIEPPSHGRLLLNTRKQVDDGDFDGVDGFTHTYAVLINISK